MPTVPPSSAATNASLGAIAAGLSDRIARIDWKGHPVWIKRTERLSWRMRLQKGNPARALTREVAALQALGARGLPVPALLGHGADWLAVPDSGPSLADLFRDGTCPDDDRHAAFAAAGAALAALHASGFVHGRPSPRDICWRDGAIRFIDLENCHPEGSWVVRRGLDALVFAFNLHALARGPAPEVDAALDAYRAAAPAPVLAAARRIATLLRGLEPLTRPWQRRDAGGGEFRAIPPALAAFTQP